MIDGGGKREEKSHWGYDERRGKILVSEVNELLELNDFKTQYIALFLCGDSDSVCVDTRSIGIGDPRVSSYSIRFVSPKPPMIIYTYIHISNRANILIGSSSHTHTRS